MPWEPGVLHLHLRALGVQSAEWRQPLRDAVKFPACSSSLNVSYYYFKEGRLIIELNRMSHDDSINSGFQRNVFGWPDKVW